MKTKLIAILYALITLLYGQIANASYAASWPGMPSPPAANIHDWYAPPTITSADGSIDVGPWPTYYDDAWDCLPRDEAVHTAMRATLRRVKILAVYSPGTADASYYGTTNASTPMGFGFASALAPLYQVYGGGGGSSYAPQQGMDTPPNRSGLTVDRFIYNSGGTPYSTGDCSFCIPPQPPHLVYPCVSYSAVQGDIPRVELIAAVSPPKIPRYQAMDGLDPCVVITQFAYDPWVLAKRKTWGADVVVFVNRPKAVNGGIIPLPERSGCAWGIPAANTRTVAEAQFAAVDLNYMEYAPSLFSSPSLAQQNRWTLMHELGHLWGARHPTTGYTDSTRLDTTAGTTAHGMVYGLAGGGSPQCYFTIMAGPVTVFDNECAAGFNNNSANNTAFGSAPTTHVIGSTNGMWSIGAFPGTKASAVTSMVLNPEAKVTDIITLRINSQLTFRNVDLFTKYTSRDIQTKTCPLCILIP